MQFQVPQFIDTEDKIVGPLSLKQFAYVAAAFVLTAMLYFALATWVAIIGGIIFFAIAGALAFVKIEGRPFANVIISAAHFYWRPQTYVWQPEHPVAVLPKERAVAADESGLEQILAGAAGKMKRAMPASPKPVHREAPAPVAQAPSRAPITPPPPPAPVVPPVAAPAEKPTSPARSATLLRAMVSAGSALHKSWEDVQTGAPLIKKQSDKQYLDRKMAERYQIFQKTGGDRAAAHRIDYR